LIRRIRVDLSDKKVIVIGAILEITGG